MRCFLRFAIILLTTIGLSPATSAQTTSHAAQIELTPQIARGLFALEAPPQVVRQTGEVPGWEVIQDGLRAGFVASTWEVTRSVGYSGQPIDMLVAVGTDGVITGARLMRQSEPILTLGLTDADIARFVAGFSGIDLLQSGAAGKAPDMPDIVSRATVSTGVIRDSLLRTARELAMDRGILRTSGINRTDFERQDWPALIAQGAIARSTLNMSQAADKLAGAKVAIPPGDGPFITLYAAILDAPSIGQNILGQQAYTRAMAALGGQSTALFVASNGLYSHRGTKWRRSGQFDRLALMQNGKRFDLSREGYVRVDKLAIDNAPALKERSLFEISDPDFDPTAPFTLELTASRPAQSGPDVRFTLPLAYQLPAAFVNDPPPEATPLWVERWEAKRTQVASVLAMLGVLTLILMFQDQLVRRRKLWQGVRAGFLATTFLWLGMVLNGQLSVVQVVAFLQSLLTGFHWETFLIEPVIFTLWGFVALGVLFWGRGVFCGWLCPFGALQELTNLAARRLNIPQIAVPYALHERLWIIKYTLFMAILALSFYSMKDAILLAEAEPFKTAISLRMMRAWPFVLFVVTLLVAGLFIERFYCRYMCPLGAALAIPSKLKVFDWLRRRPQCGRECRFCETQCTVGAIDPLGRINPNECVLCLRCQVIMNDETACMILKRRARRQAAP